MADITAADHLPDHYGRLQVSPVASQPVIDAAYQTLLRTTRGERLERLRESYAVLRDADARRAYDNRRNCLGGKVVGDYEVIEKIGEGQFGQTYRGIHILTGTPVCIKHIPDASAETREDLLHESKVLARINHHRLPGWYNTIQLDDGTVALIMKYLPYPSLAKIVATDGPRTALDTVRIIERVMNLLMYLHGEKGVIHGAINPDHILVEYKNAGWIDAYLVSFGLGVLEPGGVSRDFVKYYSPQEQVDGGAMLPESDLYSVAKTAIFALTGSIEAVMINQFPEDTPEPMRRFFDALLIEDVYDRHDWDSGALMERFTAARVASGLAPVYSAE